MQIGYAKFAVSFCAWSPECACQSPASKFHWSLSNRITIKVHESDIFFFWGEFEETYIRIVSHKGEHYVISMFFKRFFKFHE